MTEPSQDAAVTPQVTIDPTWRVTTHLGIIEVHATNVEWDDDKALLFFNDAAKDPQNREDSGLVAVVPWDMLAYGFDDRFTSVVDAPVRNGDGSAA